MLSRFQRTFMIRYRRKRWHTGLSHLWYRYHKKMFGFLISRGLKLKAYSRLSKLLFMIKKKERVEPRHIFLVACMRVTPRVIVKNIRRGSRIIYKPVPLSLQKQPGLVIKWFIKSLRDKHVRKNASLKKIWESLTLALRRRGEVHKKKAAIYKTARANRNPKARGRTPKVRPSRAPRLWRKMKFVR